MEQAQTLAPEEQSSRKVREALLGGPRTVKGPEIGRHLKVSPAEEGSLGLSAKSKCRWICRMEWLLGSLNSTGRSSTLNKKLAIHRSQKLPYLFHAQW